MKKFLAAIIVLALLAIAYNYFSGMSGEGSDSSNKVDENGVRIHTGDDKFLIGDGRLKGTWVRFNGVYKTVFDKKAQYLRFYPEGNVTSVLGSSVQDPSSLKSLMKQDIPNGENMIKNTMVTLEGDSLFFTTKGMKGLIDYRGARVDGDANSLRFLKHSLITGRKGFFEFTFEAD